MMDPENGQTAPEEAPPQVPKSNNDDAVVASGKRYKVIVSLLVTTLLLVIVGIVLPFVIDRDADSSNSTHIHQESHNHDMKPSSCDGPAVGDAATGVFVSTNGLDQNSVVSFRRMCDGSLEHAGAYDTGAGEKGFPIKNDVLLPDNPIGTQGALVVEKEYVFAVNAGSNSFSQFRIDPTDMSLELIRVTPTEGVFPCSIDARHDLGTVCVATCGGAGSISCYELEHDDTNSSPLKQVHLVESLGIPVGQWPTGNPIDPSSTDNVGGQGINVLVNVKQIQFTPAGDALYMTIFNRGLFVFPTNDMGSYMTLNAPILHSIDDELVFQHRPFSFAFEQTPSGNTLIHIQDPFATTAGELYFPPNVGIGLSGGGTLSTYRIDGMGNSTSFAPISPQIGAGQKGACWVAYKDGNAVVTNTASGTITVYRRQDFFDTEGIYDVAVADLVGTRKEDTGLVGFNAGPFATSGGTQVSSLYIDLSFSNDGKYFYVLNAIAGVVDIFTVDNSVNTIQDSKNRAGHVGAADIAGFMQPVSDKLKVGNDALWQDQIDRWGAWSPSVGMQGLDTYPRPRP